MSNVSTKVRLVLIISASTLLFLIIGSVLIIGKVRESERRNAEQNIKNAVSHTEFIIDNLKYTVKSFELEKKSAADRKVKELVQAALSIYENYYGQYKKGLLDEAVAIKKANDEVRKIKFGNGGYYFVINKDYNMVVHGAMPDKEWLPEWKDMKDKDNIYFIKEMVNNAVNKEEHYQEYWWRIKDNEEPKRKRSYVAYFKPWGLIVGTGDYNDIPKEIQDMNEKLTSQAEDIITSIRVGKSGYPYIVDDDGNLIMHPNKELKKENVNNLTDKKTGESIMKIINEAKKNGTDRFDYNWHKINSTEIIKKFAILKYDPELKWNIVVAAYEDEVYEEAANIEKYLITIILIVMVLTVLISVDSLNIILKKS